MDLKLLEHLVAWFVISFSTVSSLLETCEIEKKTCLKGMPLENVVKNCTRLMFKSLIRRFLTTESHFPTLQMLDVSFISPPHISRTFANFMMLNDMLKVSSAQ